MSNWLTDVSTLTDQDETCVLITVVSTRGSVPREAGTRMVVGNHSYSGTIGGGHLEYRAIALARAQLTDASRPSTFSKRFPLGASLGQCCGGLVYLLFERLTPGSSAWLDFLRTHDVRNQPVVMMTQLLADAQNPRIIASIKRLVVSEQDSIGELAGVQLAAIDHARRLLIAKGDKIVDTVAAGTLAIEPLTPATQVLDSQSLSISSLLVETVQPDAFAIHLFGAGHVGQAIVNVLGGLPCRVRWIDSRPDQFADALPANVQSVVSDQPEVELDNVPSGGFVLIMTHSHAMDEIICERALRRDDLAYCGLIGSDSKRRNFIRRFEARGMPAQAMDRLTCPIGISEITGKHPGEIAIAVSAELLRVRKSGKQAAADSTSCKLAKSDRVSENPSVLKSA